MLLQSFFLFVLQSFLRDAESRWSQAETEADGVSLLVERPPGCGADNEEMFLYSLQGQNVFILNTESLRSKHMASRANKAERGGSTSRPPQAGESRFSGGILIGKLVFLPTSRQLVFAATAADAAAVSGINGSSSSVNMNPL